MLIEPNTKAQPKKSKRIIELDAIRAISCLNLLLFHFTYVYQNKYGFESPLGFAFPYGKYGVQLFFMLSGMVNAMTLLSKRKAGDFLAARFIRIFPSYWLVIALNLLLFATLPMFNHTITLSETVSNLTTMPMLLGHTNMEPVTWTLQIEMLFYFFLMTLFALGFLDKPIRTMIVAATFCLISGLFINWFNASYPGSAWHGHLYVFEQLFFIRNMPLFAMGILLNELRLKRGNPIGLWGGIVFCATVFHLIDLRGHNPAATALMFGLLTASAYGRVPILRWKPFLYLSFISYALYLFHNNLGSALIRQLEIFNWPPLLSVIVATLVSILIAHALTFWLEQPLTKWLRVRYANLKTWYANKQSAAIQNTNSARLTKNTSSRKA